jgi:hypothetical protein
LTPTFSDTNLAVTEMEIGNAKPGAKNIELSYAIGP